jgi:catechol 2,3-dioxygenase-like lactoylglutathione lyase family enzyme
MTTAAFTGINHLGIVTADLDRAVRTWSDRYGIGPWRLYRYDSSNMSAEVDSEPVEFEMRVGLCQLDNARIELLQPLDDRSPYARSLAAHGGADHVHHVRFDVASYDESAARLRELGAREVFHAAFEAGGNGDSAPLTATYFATDDELGFTTEIVGVPDHFAMPEPELVYPPS